MVKTRESDRHAVHQRAKQEGLNLRTYNNVSPLPKGYREFALVAYYLSHHRGGVCFYCQRPH